MLHAHIHNVTQIHIVMSVMVVVCWLLDVCVTDAHTHHKQVYYTHTPQDIAWSCDVE